MEKFKYKKELLGRSELVKLSKEELADKILSLQAHNVQLQNIILRNNNSEGKTSKRKQKAFDFSKVHFRHILLRLYYLGWEYQGYAAQEDSANTIEFHLFEALQKTCLIESRQTANYHRCGRTDKGVSSFQQVISIDVRSKFPKQEQDSTENLEAELKYCQLLNRVLPPDIRCLCWCPVAEQFSARFDCKYRVYKYFFPKAHLNIVAMNTALKYLLGTHDFRNFCKMDVANGVVQFVRNIISASISPCTAATESPYALYELTIKGQAFLWHQVRCIVAILFLIGENKESPDVIPQLMDVESNPRKPQYNLASEIPLNLYYCDYGDLENWTFDYSALEDVVRTLQKMWTFSAVKTTMMKSMLAELEAEHLRSGTVSYAPMVACLTQGVPSHVYKPLMKRPTAETLEDKIQHYVKKGKLSLQQNTCL